MKGSILELGKLDNHLKLCIIEDILRFGKPALIYNWHHSKNVINTIDYKKDWNTEQSNMKKQ
jgi:hypothetical protein